MAIGGQQELKQGQGRKGSNMPKGNRINHKCVYARAEDLIELKQRFFSFLDNDWVHLKTKVARQEGILYVILTILGIVLAKVLGAW